MNHKPHTAYGFVPINLTNPMNVFSERERDTMSETLTITDLEKTLGKDTRRY